MSNPVKEKILTGEAALGCFVNFYSPTVVEMLGNAGYEFIVLDNEHGWFNPAEVENMIRAAEGVGLVPIVRVDYDNSAIQKVLDRGAKGIQVPMVNTKEDAERVVHRAKYPPVGQRGAAYSTRAAMYGKFGGKRYLDQQDDDVLITVHIETPEAVENFEEIVSVPGIDVAFIGPLDLAINMGYKEDGPKHPEVQKAINGLYEKAKAMNVPVGTIAGGAATVSKVMDKGVLYVATVITSLLSATFAEVVNAKTGVTGSQSTN